MILISSGLLSWNCLQVWADRSMGARHARQRGKSGDQRGNNNSLHGDVPSISLNHVVGIDRGPERRSNGRSTQRRVGEKIGGCR